MKVPRLFLLLAALLIGALLAGFWNQRDVGLADNLDFARSNFRFTSGPAGGLSNGSAVDTPEGHERYYSYWLPRWVVRWEFTRPTSSVEALWIPGLLATVAGAGGGQVDLRVLSVFPKLLLLGECLVMLIWIGRQGAHRHLLLATLGVPAVLVFTTTDYLVYLQSFYQEAATLVYVLPLLFSVVYLRRRPTPVRLAVALVCLVLMTGAKVSTTYWPVLTLPFLLWAWFAGRSVRPSSTRVWVTAAGGLVAALALSMVSLRATRGTAMIVNAFDSLFYGALTFSHQPATDLERLGLQDLAKYVGRSGYTPETAAFLLAHPNKITARDTLRTYLHDPVAIWGGASHGLHCMQDISLEYLGKYARDDPRAAAYAVTDTKGREARYWRPDLDDHFWNTWSGWKFHFFPTGWPLALCLGCFAGWFGWGLRARQDTRRDLATVGALATLACGLDLGVAIVGDGRFELIKHLFLANLLFDIAAIAFVGSVGVWAQTRWESGRGKVAPAAVDTPAT